MPASARHTRPLNAKFFDNVHVFRLLLDHGADPRLRGLWWDLSSPLSNVTYQVKACGRQTGSDWDKAKAFYDQVF